MRLLELIRGLFSPLLAWKQHVAQIKLQVDEQGYEIPPRLSPDQALPPALARSEHHMVKDPVNTDGFSNTYFVESDFGAFEVHGTGKLRKRVHEIEVLAALKKEEIKNTQVYGLAVANAATGANVPLTIVEDSFAGAREAYTSRCILVRPDHFVAWTGGGVARADDILGRVIGT